MKTTKPFGKQSGFPRLGAILNIVPARKSASLVAVNTVVAQPFRLSPGFNQSRQSTHLGPIQQSRHRNPDPSGPIVWSFGLGPNDFSANSIIGVNDAERVADYTLMAGTGTPAGVIPQSPGGAPDNSYQSSLISWARSSGSTVSLGKVATGRTR